MDLKKAYSLLMQEYGPQGWWPISGNPRTKICEKGKDINTPKHHNGRPSDDNDRFEILLGAILTQNTAWTNAEKAIRKLNERKMNTPSRILNTTHAELGETIRSAGYYNQKSTRLATISRFIIENRMKTLLGMGTQKLRQLLLSVNGIGPETADSMVLYAFEKPSFVIDAYTKRIFSRMGVCTPDEDYEELRNMFMSEVEQDVEKYKEYHALIVEHAKQHCRTKPVCEGCPLYKNCEKKYL